MVKQIDTLVEDTESAAISDRSVPDLTPLGWLPAEQIFLHAEGQQPVGEFYYPDTEEAEDTSVIEFTIADIQAYSLLADIGNQDLGSFDLTDPLEQADTAPEVSLLMDQAWNLLLQRLPLRQLHLSVK